jgi:hypothetical protein
VKLARALTYDFCKRLQIVIKLTLFEINHEVTLKQTETQLGVSGFWKGKSA